MTVVNEGEVGQAARRDSPSWRDLDWANKDQDLREVDAAGISYDPEPLAGIKAGGLYLLYGPRRVGKTVSVKQTVRSLLCRGVNPLRIVRVTVDGWTSNRIGTLYEQVVRVLTTSVEDGEPRYWFIDEVTASQGPWWSVVKSLRDNTALGGDCVVLTGSSNRDLDQAIKAFAGRRGAVADPDRALLPMDFAAFCRSLSIDTPSLPQLRADELMSSCGRDVWSALAPYMDDVNAAWQAYLYVGGYPKAVSDWRRTNNVEVHTWQALWDVVRGDAITSGMSEAVLGVVLEGLARRLTSLTNVTSFAREAGIGREALTNRVDALIAAFLVWVCPRADREGRPDLGKQSKFYFLDPLLARLPELVHGRAPIDVTRLNEQQLGNSLLQWNERVRPGSIRSGHWVTHYRTDGGEVDFAGICSDTLTRATPVEGKYVSGSWGREALKVGNTALGGGILATRDVLDLDSKSKVWAVPASFLAYALSATG